MTPAPDEPFFPPENGRAPAETGRAVRPQPYAPETPAFDRLRALVRRGYVADMEAEGPGGGMLLRHPAAPDIVLYPDGAVESIARKRRGRERVTSLTGDLIPAENASDERRFARFLERLPEGAQRADPPRKWRKRFVVIFLLLAVWLVSLFLTIALVNG